jgi:hypothetical protein
MRRMVVLVCVACLAVVAWTMLAVPRSRQADAIALKGLRVGEPYRHANLAIFPVISQTPRSGDRFITLDEGLHAGTVEIYEVGADGGRIAGPGSANAPQDAEHASQPPAGEQSGVGAPPGAAGSGAVNPPAVQQLPLEPGSRPPAQPAPTPSQTTAASPPADNFDVTAGAEVNRLMVVNRSGKPLYLMPGEVIVGGRQDRTIAEEMILAATGEPTPIDVFCVEHGRWSGRDEQEAAGILAAIAEPQAGRSAADDDTTLSMAVRQANSGKFVASAGVLDKASRLATQAVKSQPAVWDAVAQQNAAAGVSSGSDAFTANYADAGNRQRLEAYLEQLQQRVFDEPNAIGVVVAINGKVEAVDVFESTPLFRKLWPKLLKSYALDAAVAADAKHAARRPRLSAANDFLAKALTAEVKDESHGQGGLLVQQRAADGVISFTAGEQDAAATPGSAALPPAASFGGYGGGVHTSALAH